MAKTPDNCPYKIHKHKRLYFFAGLLVLFFLIGFIVWWLFSSVPWPTYTDYDDFSNAFKKNKNIWIPDKEDWNLTDTSFYQAYTSLGKRNTRRSKVTGYILSSEIFPEENTDNTYYVSMLCMQYTSDNSKKNGIKPDPYTLFGPTLREEKEPLFIYLKNGYLIDNFYSCHVTVRVYPYDYSFSICSKELPDNTSLLTDWINNQVDKLLVFGSDME